MVEQGNVALDASPADKLDRDTLNVLDRRLAAKERLAAAWNRGDFGKQAAVSVTLGVADWHLAALKEQARAIAQVSAGVAVDDDDDNVADWQIEGADSTQESGHETGTQIATVGENP